MAKINGTAGADVLNGTADNDIINGGLGADTMTGGLGSDIYYVDDAGDTVVEALGEGTDTVYSSITHTLAANVENLFLTGKANINATGNAGDNRITGNRGNNVIDGGGGTDIMIGGKGDDTYYVNQFNLTGINDGTFGDFIIDTGGNDTVVALGVNAFTDLKYVMQKGLENLFFTGTDNFEIIGNNSKNNITTGDGDDILNGGKGADTLTGGDGANSYYIDNKRDVIVDTFDDVADEDKWDTAYISSHYVMAAGAEIENIVLEGTKSLKLTASDTDNVITGNAKKNVIHGGGGDDTIDGGGGKDQLWGDLGADTFYFDADTAFGAPVSIMDFSIAQNDKIDISDILDGYSDGMILSAFVSITDKGRDSIVKVNATGDGNPANFLHIATIKGVTGLVSEELLETAGILITETA